MMYAHSVPGRPETDWEPLAAHLHEVGDLAARFAAPFGAAALGRAAGLLHDIGKAAAAYQTYIRPGGGARGPDHSTAGARAAIEAYGELGRLIAFGIAGHHGGLMDGQCNGRRASLATRLDPGYSIEAHAGWRDHAAGLPAPADFRLTKPWSPAPDATGFERAFLIRMLFSCLVDADFIATERFYAHAAGQPEPARGGRIDASHLDRIRHCMTGRRRDDTPVNRLRAEVLDHAVAKAALAPGPFTLTVPTGGGKTLTSLQFAIEHAQLHKLDRIIYVIPYTSIIEQTAKVFREVLGDGDILEHHAAFDWDQRPPAREGDAEGEGREGLAKLRRAAENWDAPIVVTTAVQFFESLFAARTSQARKLHNLANSVIILDEAQTLPVPLLRPCMAALGELTRNYGASVVLCTATQPALRRIDGALPLQPGGTPAGFDIDETRELAPRPRELYREMRRVAVAWRREPVADAEIVARFAAQPRMLCIVNTRKHARDLFEAIRDQPGARHLTTLMCARHRRDVLATARTDLQAGAPVRLISTSLIEAGVDISFPEVWRAATGLDSIAQAAGRCNREGELAPELGRAVIFAPAAVKLPRAMQMFWEAARLVLPHHDDPLGLDAVKAYFVELWFRNGREALDSAQLDGRRFAILDEIAHTATNMNFPFERIADAFRLIDDVMEPVLVPFDDDAIAAIAMLRVADRPPREVLRRLQQYSVAIPAAERRAMLASGAAQAVAPEKYGDRFIALGDLELYDRALGLRLGDATTRSAASNIA